MKTRLSLFTHIFQHIPDYIGGMCAFVWVCVCVYIRAQNHTNVNVRQNVHRKRHTIKMVLPFSTKRKLEDTST